MQDVLQTPNVPLFLFSLNPYQNKMLFLGFIFDLDWCSRLVVSEYQFLMNGVNVSSDGGRVVGDFWVWPNRGCETCSLGKYVRGAGYFTSYKMFK